MHLFDRYLQINKQLTKTQIQVLGVTAFHIAGKYEEIHPPSLR